VVPDSARPRVGVVGVGYLGALHAAKLAALADRGACELVGVHDLDPARGADVAAQTGCEAFASLDELLTCSDAVTIAVPTLAHADVGCRVAAAGVHMLMEKPLAADSPSAARLADAAARADVLVQVGHLERFNPVFDDVHRVVSAPRFIECHRLSPFAGRGADTDVVFDVMIHDLDIISFLVGREVATVEAVGVPVLSAKLDIANARIRFEGGCIANVTASRVSLKRERKLRVFQEDGYVSIDFDAASALLATHKPGSPPPAQLESPMEAIAVEQRSFDDADPLLAELEAFVECVRAGEPPLVGIAEGLKALALADRVVSSLETL